MSYRRFKEPHCKEPDCPICIRRANDAEKQRRSYERRKEMLRAKKAEVHRKRMEDPERRERQRALIREARKRVAEGEQQAIAPLEEYIEKRLDLIIYYGGVYEPVHEDARPFRYQRQTDRPRINGEHVPLYDIWFVLKGKRVLIGVTRDWKSISKMGDTVLEDWINILNEEGAPLQRLAGSELVITDRPDQAEVYRTKWSVVLRGA